MYVTILLATLFAVNSYDSYSILNNVTANYEFVFTYKI